MKGQRFSWLKHCPHWFISMAVTAYFLLMFNQVFFTTVSGLHGAGGLAGGLFIAGLFVFLLLIINLLLSIVTLPWLAKPTLILLLLTAPFAAYFIDTYNILIDKGMIENIMATDLKESQELFSFQLLGYFILTGLLPAILVARTRIDYGSISNFLYTQCKLVIFSLPVICLIALVFYQDYASLFRNHRYIRDLIVPVNYVYSLESYAKQFLPHNIPEFQTIGADVHLGDRWQEDVARKTVTVLIVGETARSASFSLYDYPRQTTPLLAKQNIISFSDVSSCGTSTAASLPCMFSRFNHDNYQKARANHSDNLLDILQRAGFNVVWLDNNSGCKGVCDRLDSIADKTEDSPLNDKEFCNENECFDMILLNQLKRTLSASNKNTVIVMHQHGSHGPAYFLRTPKEFQKFTPYCHTNQLQECSQQEIINAYDNTILYTDFFVSSVIDYLKSQQNNFDASLVYVSDHGESLGENNIYLHGLPYLLAPDEQKKVPLLLWLSEGYSQRQSIDIACINNKREQALSHDNLFDSMLGMLDVKTSAYIKELDFFNTCHTDNTLNQISLTSSTSLQAPSLQVTN